MPSELMERQLGVASPPPSDILSALTDELNRLDVEYHALLAEAAAKRDELTATEQRIRNGERDCAARRSRKLVVPPAWVALLAQLRVKATALAGDVAEAETRAEAVLATFTSRLGRYEYEYDARRVG